MLNDFQSFRKAELVLMQNRRWRTSNTRLRDVFIKELECCTISSVVVKSDRFVTDFYEVKDRFDRHIIEGFPVAA